MGTECLPHTISDMATPIWGAANAPQFELAGAGSAGSCETTSLNLPENSDSMQQQEVLDALPVLVFLERAGQRCFRQRRGTADAGHRRGEWVERPVEDVLWGLFPGTAEPQTHLIRLDGGSPFHATLPTRSGRILPVEGTYSILNADLREAIIVAHPSAARKAPKSRLMEDVLASIPEAVVIRALQTMCSIPIPHLPRCLDIRPTRPAAKICAS